MRLLIVALGLALLNLPAFAQFHPPPIPFPTDNAGNSFHCVAPPDNGVVEYFGDCHYHWSTELSLTPPCRKHELGRFWQASPLHPGNYDFMIDWVSDCENPDFGVLNMGYDTGPFQCAGDALLTTQGGITMCYCPLTVYPPTNQVIPQVFEDGHCQPDMAYVNPLVVPEEP